MMMRLKLKTKDVIKMIKFNVEDLIVDTGRLVKNINSMVGSKQKPSMVDEDYLENFESD